MFDQVFYDPEKFFDMSSAPKDGTLVWLTNPTMRANKFVPVKASWNSEKNEWIGKYTDYVVTPDAWCPVVVREDEPRAWTKEELCDRFVKHLMVAAREWANCPDKTPLERTEGLVHTVLATIDGCSMMFPTLNLVPDPHDEDKEYNISEGFNYFDKEPINDCISLRYLINKHKNKS